MENNIFFTPTSKIPFFVLLHQLGSNEKDLLFLKDKLPKNSFIISIKGPYEWTTEIEDGCSWFDIDGNSLGNFSNIEQIEKSTIYVNSILTEIMIKYPFLDDPIFIGVSQGGILALHLCLEKKINNKGVVCLLGFYEVRLDCNVTTNTPVLMINGITDSVIPYDWAEKSYYHLKNKGKNITGMFLNSGHEITEEMIDISMLWIYNLLK